MFRGHMLMGLKKGPKQLQAIRAAVISHNSPLHCVLSVSARPARVITFPAESTPSFTMKSIAQGLQTRIVHPRLDLKSYSPTVSVHGSRQYGLWHRLGFFFLTEFPPSAPAR